MANRKRSEKLWPCGGQTVFFHTSTCNFMWTSKQPYTKIQE